MEIVALTETFADVRVRIQVIIMRGAVHVWASTADRAPTLALAIPGRRAAASTLMPGEGSGPSLALASRLASRTGLAVYACLQLPGDAEMICDAVVKRIVKIIEDGNAGAAVAASMPQVVDGTEDSRLSASASGSLQR
jgi:Proteasome assembly chaperone 4